MIIGLRKLFKKLSLQNLSEPAKEKKGKTPKPWSV
jgi:hypothetical protein